MGIATNGMRQGYPTLSKIAHLHDCSLQFVIDLDLGDSGSADICDVEVASLATETRPASGLLVLNDIGRVPIRSKRGGGRVLHSRDVEDIETDGGISCEDSVLPGNVGDREQEGTS